MQTVLVQVRHRFGVDAAFGAGVHNNLSPLRRRRYAVVFSFVRCDPQRRCSVAVRSSAAVQCSDGAVGYCCEARFMYCCEGEGEDPFPGALSDSAGVGG